MFNVLFVNLKRNVAIAALGWRIAFHERDPHAAQREEFFPRQGEIVRVAVIHFLCT